MRIENGESLMISEYTVDSIVAHARDIASTWEQIREILYNKSSIRVSNAKDFSYRERSVRGCVRSLKRAVDELNQESTRTDYANEKISRKTENLRGSLDRLQYLLQESFVQIESAEKLESLMMAFEDYISELECTLESFADQLELSYAERLRQDSFNYEIVDEDND